MAQPTTTTTKKPLAKDPTSCSAGKSVFCFSKAAFDVGTSQSKLKMYNSLAPAFTGKNCRQICATDKIKDGIGQCCTTATILPQAANNQPDTSLTSITVDGTVIANGACEHNNNP
ncbi:hypothetical protein PCANC_22131 [Puccinia coronata f. sp. avenae]|uniref:Uncharacterized protein n=1 Tax=Puccinia coronata f. sp. avenae TaxID=200324 RepID=A0A2N5SHD5_9BASI|nr:hypothetical protein PCANC_22131 [Puccinia coronata f. sp. avenae]